MKRKSFIFFLFISALCQGQMVNPGFEQTIAGAYTSSTAVTGWTIESRTANSICTYTDWTGGSSEFSIMATPLVYWPFSNSPITVVPNSPFGGNVVAQINDATADNNMTRLRQNIPITQSTTLLQYAYAGYWEDGGSGHTCCDQPELKFNLYDCQGNIISCKSMSVNPTCSSSGVTYTTASGSAIWNNWQVKYVDLTPYIGSCVTIEFINTDCGYGCHFGTTLLDVVFQLPIIAPCMCVLDTPPGPVAFCSGSNYATITGPVGYSSYYWTSPITGTSIPGAYSNTLGINNPLANTVYTLYVTTVSGCVASLTYALVSSQVQINAHGTSPTCLNGYNGSATVAAMGSANGYTYTWLNSLSSVVSTASVATGLSQGNYTVTVGGYGTSCGTASLAVTVGTTAVSKQSLFAPYCPGGSGYLNANSGGTNYKWYNNGTLITGSLATSSSYTVTSPCNACKYQLGFNNQGCRDSIEYTFVAVSPGSLTVPSLSIKPICISASNGTAAIVISPAIGAPVGLNGYNVIQTGSTSAFSASLAGSNSNTLALNGLSGGTYSVNAFDGICNYTTTFTVNPVTFNYTLSPQSATLCPGNSIPAGAYFSSPPTSGQYTYSWSPTTWLPGNNGNIQQTLITPTGAASGAFQTNVYTVVVTPSIAPCPLTKTLSITAANPVTPTITPIAPFCTNQTTIQLSASPGTGTFINAFATPGLVNSSGVLDPQLATPGINSFTYAISMSTCIAAASQTFSASQFYSAQLFVNHMNLCEQGPPTTLNTLAQNTVSAYWNGPGVQGANFLPSSLSPGNYTITHIAKSFPDSTLCPDSAPLTVHVDALPVISATSGSICSGESFTLQASGAPTFSYSSVNPVVSPNATTTYSIWGISQFGCVSANAALAQVAVVPAPVINIQSSNDLPCAGEQVTLTASGATNYTWTSGPNSNNYIIVPAYSTMYQVAGEQANCTSSAYYVQNVLACTGLSNLNASQIKIYPNPTTHFLYVESPGLKGAYLKLNNTLGQTVFEFNLIGDNVQIDLGQLSSGVYILEVSDQTNVLTKRPLILTEH